MEESHWAVAGELTIAKEENGCATDRKDGVGVAAPQKFEERPPDQTTKRRRGRSPTDRDCGQDGLGVRRNGWFGASPK